MEKIGTNGYLSPEVALNLYHAKSDVWSLGIIMYCLVVGKPLYSNVFSHLSEPDSLDYIDISPEGKDLLIGMLEPKCSDRISLQDCKEHIWINY